MPDQTITTFEDLLRSMQELSDDFVDAVYVHSKSWALGTLMTCAMTDFDRPSRNAALAQILIGISMLVDQDYSNDETQTSFAVLGADGEIAASLFVDADQVLHSLAEAEWME